MKVGYARVSSTHQAEGESLDQQVARLKRAGAEQVLSETISGRSEKRSQFDLLIDLVKNGKVEELIVTRVDRLGRSTIGIHKTVEILQKYKTELRVLDAPVNVKSAFGRFALSQMADLAAFESELLSERIRHGKDYQRLNNKVVSGKVCFGYVRSHTGVPVPSEKLLSCGLTEWQVAQGCIDIFFQEGILRKAAIAIYEKYQLKISVQGLRDWLRNPQLEGHIVYSRRKNLNNPELWDYRRNTHEALLTRDRAQQIKDMLQRNKSLWSGKPLPSLEYPLAGQIFCSFCGSRCYRAGTEKRKRQRISCRKHNDGAQYCPLSHSTLIQECIDAASEALRTRAKQLAEHATKPEGKEEDPKLIELKKQVEVLSALGDNPAIALAIEDLRSQIQSFDISQKQGNSEYIKEELTKTFMMESLWDELSQDDLIKYFKLFVDKVFIGERDRKPGDVTKFQKVGCVVEVKLKV